MSELLSVMNYRSDSRRDGVPEGSGVAHGSADGHFAQEQLRIVEHELEDAGLSALMGRSPGASVFIWQTASHASGRLLTECMPARCASCAPPW
jgi:hypothetical protein